MAEQGLGKGRGQGRKCAGGDSERSRAPLGRPSPATLSMLCMPGHGQMGGLSSRGRHISRREHMPEGYHRLTYEERCQIYALMQSASRRPP